MIAIFGLGLIGSAVLNALKIRADFSVEARPFRWADVAESREDGLQLINRIAELLHWSDSAVGRGNVAFVWSAGKAGFSCSEEEAAGELACFGVVMEMAQSLQQSMGCINFSFHLVSSLGGLYEGIRNVTRADTIAPTRPYGLLKLQQETLLRKSLSTFDTEIYRPASIYDFPGAGFRMGLIPTLIRNGMCNRVSTIIGGMSTLRDYVLASDLGFYIATKVLGRNSRRIVEPRLLASGKPSTIFEVQEAVEERLRRRIFISFNSDPALDNSSDITVSRSALPKDWNPTDLKTGIGIVMERMYRRGAIRAIT